MRPFRLPLVLSTLPLLALLSMAASAQETVIPTENVRYDYAQVLRVEPVYQTLTASSMEQQCDDQVAVAPARPQAKGLSRIVGKVRDVLTPRDRAVEPPPTDNADCRMVRVQRQYRRPIAFDVDYMYKGMKYRSRLSEDPGNRLRVRVSVTPYVAPAAH
jgi:uncharacterized protein YcfJ